MFSTNWLALFALGVVALMFWLIFFLGKRGLNWNLQFVISLILGIGVGIVFRDNQYFANNLEYVRLIGTIYIGITEALVVPLVFVAILSSVTQLNNAKQLKTLGSKSIFWLTIHTVISIVLTLIVCTAIGVGKNVSLSIEGLNATKYENIGTKFTDVLTGFFPRNIVAEMADNRIIPIILFALALAVAYITYGEKQKVEPFKNFIEAAKELVYKVVGYIVDLIPFIVLPLAADAAVKTGSKLSALLPLLLIIVVIYVLCILQTFVVGGLLVKFVAKLSPVRFFKKISGALIMGFTTQSTIAVLPTTINSLIKKVGVKEEVSNFTASIGATVGMPGCAGIWPVALAVFTINYLKLPYTPVQYVTLGIIALAVSYGTAGVSGTAVITATAVFTTAGLPLEVFVLLMPISFIVGMARTPTNVSCQCVSAAIVARQTGELNEDIFYDRQPAPSSLPLVATEA